MTAIQVLDQARRLGVRLVVAGERLRYEAPPGAMTPDLAALIRQHRPGIVRALTVATDSRPNAAKNQAVPTACLASMVCGVVGICGRLRCLPEEERGRFMDAARTARSPDNPHRVPDFDSEAA